MSFIFKDISEDLKTLESLGYFEPKQKFFSEIEPGYNFVSNISGNKSINKDTLIVYYTGAFTYFHIGHYNLIVKAYESLKESHPSKDIRIVISPSNSDYIFDKYGPEFNVGNKIRYERIVRFITNQDCNFLEDIIIDLNPMLNTKYDYNFTDLLKNFVEKYVYYKDLENTPYILCGKDKSYFKNLEKHTEKVKVFYSEGCGTSSSDNLRLIGEFNKKNVILRVHTKEEFNLFKKYLGDYYSSITPFYIKDEVKYIRELLSNIKPGTYNNIYTNCRDYRSFLPYVKVRRCFKHPLDFNPTIEADEIKAGDLYVDSDSFTGLTRNYIKDKGSNLICIYDFRLKQDTHDIVDIDDLYKSDFRYPFYDLSERMGLPIFDKELHKNFNNLRLDLIFH